MARLWGSSVGHCDQFQQLSCVKSATRNLVTWIMCHASTSLESGNKQPHLWYSFWHVASMHLLVPAYHWKVWDALVCSPKNDSFLKQTRDAQQSKSAFVYIQHAHVHLCTAYTFFPSTAFTGNVVPDAATCLLQDLFVASIVKQNGFEYIGEGSDGSKKGFISQVVGSQLHFQVSSMRDGIKDHVVRLYLSYLSSYEHMGKANVGWASPTLDLLSSQSVLEFKGEGHCSITNSHTYVCVSSFLRCFVVFVFWFSNRFERHERCCVYSRINP